MTEVCKALESGYTCTTTTAQTFLQKIEPFKGNITIFLVALLVACVIIYITYVCNETYRFESCDRVRIAEIEAPYESDEDGE